MAVNPVLRQLVADGKATKNAQSGTQTKMTAAKSAAQSTPMRRSLSNQQKTTSGTKKTDALTSAIISTNQKAAQKKTNTAERGSKHYTNRANQQRRAQAQVVANQIKKNNAERANKYSLGKGVAGAVAKGVNQAAQGVASTLAMAEDVALAPFELLSGQQLGELSDTAPLNKLAQRIKNEGQETQKKYADNVAKGGKAAELLDKYGAATVAAVPQAVMAYLTAGASAGASTAGLGAQAAAEMTPSMAGTIRRGVTAMAKDPNYWTAFSQVVGQSYDEAMDDMAKTGTENNKARTKAALYAMGNGLFNAAVEVGGGIQKLPEELKHGANAWKAWVDSAVDEGKEEAVQGVIERALQNGVYHKGNKLASLSDGDAILNPRTAAEEFTGGAVVGGALGGGQIGVNAMLNAMNRRGNGAETPDVDAGARQATSEGNFTPAQKNAADGAEIAAESVPAPVDVTANQSAVEQDARQTPPRTETVSAETSADAAPENHIDNRTAESVAPRSVNAFSFDHPELRGYYVEAAEQIAGIADLSRQYGQQMGARERTANGYKRTSSIYETPALRAAMNEGLTRSQIIDAADRLIKDHGQENVKAAKTLELILDDMLTNGYTNVAGEQVGPNAAYLAAKAQIDGAQPVQARQAEELPIWDMDVPDDLPGSIGAARAGYQAPDVEPMERTSRLAESAARYTQAEGDATARSREDYDALFRYRAQSEAESLAKADDLVYIERDGKRQFLKDVDPDAYEELTQYLEYAPAWNAQMVDAAMQIKNELQGRSIAMEITEDEYTRWLDIMREHATETGRGTQAWAKYSREGNEVGQSSELSAWENLQKSNLSDTERAERFRSILMYDKIIEQAETPEAMRDIILDIAEERGTLNGITGRQSAMLRKAAESALGSMDFVQLKQFAYESSAALSTDAQSANMGQKLKTVQVLNMLSNPKTAAKNIAGNTTFYALDAMSMRGAAVLDMALSKLTGTRSVAFEKSAMSSESRAAIMKAIRMSAAEITLDVDMGASGRYEQTGNRTFKASGNIIDRVLSACERNMGYLLTTSDEAYKGAARSTQRGTQELIESGKIQNAPKGYAESQADALAKYRTFQNDSKTATAIQTIHDVLNMALGVGDSGKTIKGKTVHSFGAGDIIAPFTRVAGNLASVGLDYSPVNAVKGTVEIVEAVADAARNGANPAKQAKAVSDFARGMTGTAIAYGFMQLAKMGLLKRADDEDDKDVAALNKSEGMTGAQINITAAKRWMDGDETGEWRNGDTLVDLSNLEPLNFMVSLGADMALDESSSILSPFVATKDSILSAAGDLPVLQTVGGFAKDVMVYGTPVEQAAAESLGKTVISSITPNVLAAIAKGIDDKQRNVYAGDGTKDVLIDTLKSRIPKVRETLPTTVNTLGEEKDNPGSLSKRLTNALINPIGVNKYTQSEVSQEMERVRGATGETGFYPTTRKPDSLSYKDADGKEHTVVLDYDQKQAFQKACATGQMAYTAAMMKTSIYKAAGDTTKAELLDRCYKYSYEAAKAEVLGDGAVDKWVLHARNAKSELGMSTVDYLANFEKYGSDVMSGTGFEKTKRMLDAGLSLDDWAKMRGSVDADENGSVKKAELTGYIESHFPKEQWRALFDAYKGGQNWKNPY